jgi:hypothetical protein
MTGGSDIKGWIKLAVERDGSGVAVDLYVLSAGHPLGGHARS